MDALLGSLQKVQAVLGVVRKLPVSSGPEALKDAQDAGFLHPISASPSFRHHSSMDRAPQSKEEDVGLEILECWGGG